jgi:glycosyltransferase involved in cell wall biosynthesis
LLERVPAERRGSVELAGDLRDDDLVAAYATATVAVTPSVYEALGLATLEAFACGTPVAGARSGATATLVTPDVGCLYVPADVDGCAAAVLATIRLAAVPATAARCRSAAEPYDWRRIATEVERRYEALLRRA